MAPSQFDIVPASRVLDGVPCGDGRATVKGEHWAAVGFARQVVVLARRAGHGGPDSFRARIRSMSLGPAVLSDLTYGPLLAQRTPRLIRQSDPGLFQLAYVRSGEQGVDQAANRGRVGAGELVLYDSSLPFTARSALGSRTSRALVLQFSHQALRLPPGGIKEILAVPLPGRAGTGRVLARLLSALAEEYEESSARELAQAGQTALDLTAAFLGGCLHRDPLVAPGSHHHLLFLRISAFVHDSLDDPALTPAAVAAAHGMSLRQLQRVFRREGSTVATFIRERRLTRCRRDLADPALRGLTAHAIGARWGFPAAPGFTRAFREYTGVTPGQFRAASLVRRRTPEPGPRAGASGI